MNNKNYKIELKESDKKLLAYLYHSYREHYTKIAKETGLSRIQVEYKINKYLKEGLILKFMTVIDYSKLGYNYLISGLIKFEKPIFLEKFFKKLSKNKNCISYGKVMGKYDLYMNLIFQNEEEFNEFLNSFVSDNDSGIFDYFFSKHFFTEFYDLKFLKKKFSDKRIFSLTHSNEKIKLDKNDLKILYLMEKDTRVRLIDIAKEVNISSELALYKLKRLYSEKIILGTRVLFDMNKLGYSFAGLTITLKNFSEETKNKLIKFARNHPYVNCLLLYLSKPNCYLQFFYKNSEELTNSIQDLIDILKDEPFEYDVLLFSKENEEINTLPFY